MRALLFLSLAFATPAFASSPSTIKTCTTTISSPDGTLLIPTVIEFIETDGVVKSKFTQIVNNQPVTRNDAAEVSELTIRPGLKAEMDPEGLNTAELLIVHAMTMGADPIMKGSQNAGIDLAAARSAKVFLIGKPTHMGLSAVIEAKDQDGKNLGSYLGGFLVSPCK